MKKKRKDQYRFRFTIARPWDETKPLEGANLCIYTYHSDVHFGTIENARAMLGYVMRMTDEKYYIVKLNEEVIE